MNLEEFNKNFPSYEKQFEEELAQKVINEQLHRKIKFEKQFPLVSWNSLKIQSDNVITDDNRTHYKNIITNTVYSWNKLKQTWEVTNDRYQRSLLSLFA